MDEHKDELHWFEKLPNEERDKQRSRRRKDKRSIFTSDKLEQNEKTVSFEKYTTETERWINEVGIYLKNTDRKDWAWNALRGVLHALRDRIPPEEVFQFSAQLPMLIRGLFFTGYNINNKPEKFHLNGFTDRIEDALGPAAEIEAEVAFKAVLMVLYGHISEGELQDIHATLPKDIRKLWDRSTKKHTV